MNKAFYKVFLFVMVGMLLSNSLIKGALFVNYLVNQAEITKQFCKNKAKPKLNCNGKCHLAKQFAKHDKQEKTTSETQKFKVESVEIAAQINEAISFVYPIQTKSTNNHYAYSEARSDAHLVEIFHPPTV
jgi:hypothetical protein